MKITAKDGKDGFKTVEECLAYETELEAKEREAELKRQSLKFAKASRLDKMHKAYKALIKDVDEYEKDYGEKLNIPEYNGIGIRFRSPFGSFEELNKLLDKSI